MAGAILISRGIGIPINSFGLDYIAERIRREISVKDWPIVCDVYRAYDHEGMMFLDLTESTPQCFAIFYLATLAAMKATDSHNLSFLGNLWEGLRQELEADPRHTA
jgi:hypothetical protein